MGRDILNLSTKQLDRGISCVEFYRGNIAEISRKKKIGTEVPGTALIETPWHAYSTVHTSCTVEDQVQNNSVMLSTYVY